MEYPTIRAMVLFVIGFLPMSLWADEQGQRLGYIQQITARGILQSTSVENGIARLVVPPKFFESDARSQQDVARVVYEYYQEEGYDTVVVIEGNTGAQIGVISASGLQLN